MSPKEELYLTSCDRFGLINGILQMVLPYGLINGVKWLERVLEIEYFTEKIFFLFFLQ